MLINVFRENISKIWRVFIEKKKKKRYVNVR